MNLKKKLQDDKREIERKLDIIDRVPGDTFPLGTIAVISLASGRKWYIIKTDEETWQDIKRGNEKDLAQHIFDTVEANSGYFEVYIMTTDETPIYASA